MEDIVIKLTTKAGNTIYTAVDAAIDLFWDIRETFDIDVLSFTFNDVTLFIHEDHERDKIIETYYRVIENRDSNS